ncbi:MAG: hypothetical protein KDD69_05105 [Bdellovibrionales bacterium]|nr:hypothetical protein [Bdellovibrionales bacterium]
MKHEEMTQTLLWTKQLLDFDTASGPAREWWQELEAINEDRIDLVLKLASELLARHATIDDFFLACSYSNREGVKENLRFLDTIKQDPRPTPSEDDGELEVTPEKDDDSSLLH